MTATTLKGNELSSLEYGFDALFVTAAELIDDLSAAFVKGNLNPNRRPLSPPDALVVDEIGNLTYGSDAANLLFHVVNEPLPHARPR